MNGFSPRKAIRRRLHRSLVASAERLESRSDLARSAVVFSPHPDDETLGCGGTIARKTAAGATVAIVVLTDGGRSHGHLMPVDELVEKRAAEALAAAGILGVAQDDVVLLGFEDGRLDETASTAIAKVTEILDRHQPEEVFIPYRGEPPGDHVAANRIVRAALGACGRNVTVYEYAVWFWCHWPWARPPFFRRRQLLGRFRHTVRSGVSLLRDFRCAVDVRDVLATKRRALDQYESQMTRLVPDPRWATFRDVSGGEFLDCCLGNYEFFSRSRNPAGAPDRT